MPESDDYESELRGDIEEPMNVKAAGFGPALLAGLAAALGTTVINRLFDHTTDTTTATAIARLEVQVSGLSDQVSQLTKQPYVRREEFENRVSGLERRVDRVERPNGSR